MLIQQEKLAPRTHTEAQISSARRPDSLLRVLGTNHFQEGLGGTVVIEQNPANRAGTAFGRRSALT